VCYRCNSSPTSIGGGLLALFDKIKNVKNKEIISDIQITYAKMKNSIEQDSYFGYIDAKILADDIIIKCEKIYKQTKKEVLNLVNAYNSKIKNYLSFYNTLNFKYFSEIDKKEIEQIAKKIETIIETLTNKDLNLDEIENIKKICQEIEEKKIQDIEIKINKLTIIDKSLTLLIYFVKWLIPTISAIIIVFFLILPFLSNILQIQNNLLSTLIIYKGPISFWSILFSCILTFVKTIKKI